MSAPGKLQLLYLHSTQKLTLVGSPYFTRIVKEAAN